MLRIVEELLIGEVICKSHSGVCCLCDEHPVRSCPYVGSKVMVGGDGDFTQ